MKIIRKKAFEKKYFKLLNGQQKRVDEAIKIFVDNPHDIRLHNHKLKGKFLGMRSISAGGDLRIIFEEFDNYIVVMFITIGSHSQLYG
jgi:addiction module RelE/StbE family toxin